MRIRKKSNKAVKLLALTMALFMLFSAFPSAVFAVGPVGYREEDAPNGVGDDSPDPAFNPSGEEHGHYIRWGGDYTYSHSEDVSKQNVYILNTVTGNSGGENVSCFRIEYTNGGLRYSELVFPDTAKKAAYEFGENIGVNFFDEKNGFLTRYTNFEMESPSSARGVTALAKGASDQMMFRLPRTMESLVSISVYGDYRKGGNNTWSCQSMRLYKVNVSYGLDCAGYISADWVNVFDGELVARTSSALNCNWDGKDTVFTFSYEANSKYKLEKTLPGGGTAVSADGSAVLFEMDIADMYGAGLEYLESAYNAASLDEVPVAECLRLTLTYTDVCGAESSVDVPLVTSYFVSLCMAAGDSFDSTANFTGLFQQGDTIAIRLLVPGYVAAKKCRIAFTSGSRQYSDLFASSGNTFVDNDVKFSVSAIRIYENQQGIVKYRYDGSSFVPEHEGSPAYYMVSKSYSGTEIALNNSAGQFSLNPYKSGNASVARLTGSNYLIAVTTDAEVDQAGTADDAYIKLLYTKSNGMAVETDEFNIRTLARNYYGVWSSGRTETRCFCSEFHSYEGVYATAYGKAGADIGYYINMQKGKTIYFTLPLSDVSSFTGIKLRLDGDDEWQISNISIYQLTAMGKRKVNWTRSTVSAISEPVMDGIRCDEGRTETEVFDGMMESFKFGTTVNGFANTRVQTVPTDRVITRDTESIECARYEADVLIQKDSQQAISFEHGSVYTEDVDWNSYTYYMSYESTKQNLGFTKARITYKVEVQVGDDTKGDNDCGSKNQFYFQLIFASGKSGYVLANQQLSADGFRTGELEVFYISVNRDYGDLQAIHIIPENPNESDDVYDKLKIDFINVTRIEESGFSITWTVDIGDWISIDYQDSAAKDSVGGQAGRNEAEIARTYVVTGTGYVANLLISFTTGAYAAGSPQFSGHISAELKYRDVNDQDQVLPIDVTKEMYNYANRSAVGKVYLKGGEYAANDKSFMMREYHTDRFVVNIKGLRQVQSIRFTLFDDNTGDWNCSNVSMYLVKSTGQRTINANQEYEKSGSKSLLTTSAVSESYTTHFYDNSNSSPEIQMADNLVKIEDLGTSVVATVDYVPQNKDDTMNVYVHMAKQGTAITAYDMNCAVDYGINRSTENGTEITDKIYRKAIRLRTDSAANMFYATGVSASGLVNVCSLSLHADSYATNTRALVDYAVVEHVRSGVAIETYYIPFGSVNAAISTASASPTGAAPTAAEYVQRVSFMMSEASTQNLLVNKTDDIAVSITYTSMDGATSHTLTSPNVFLSESDSSVIYPGRVYTVEFNQPNVSSITGVSFVATGSIAGAAGIRNACAGNYIADASGKETCLGWYSFAGGLNELSTSPRSMILTASTSDTDDSNSTTVSPVKFKIRTAGAVAEGESGTNCPVRMTISYYDAYGDLHTSEYGDINTYAAAGTTNTGDTIDVELLVSNMTALRSVSLEPYAAKYGASASWSVAEITCETGSSGEETSLTRAVNAVAEEGKPVTVNLGAVFLSVNAFSYDSGNRTSYNKVFTSNAPTDEAVLIGTDREITFTPTLSGSTQGVTVRCYRIVNGAQSEDNGVIDVSGSSLGVRSVRFGSEENGIPEGQYKLVFSSSEFPAVSTVILVNAEKPKAAETTTTAETTTEKIEG